MKPPKKREWPKMAHGPLGNSATFQCRGDVPAGWTVVGEKPAPWGEPTEGLKPGDVITIGNAPAVTLTEANFPLDRPKNKGGRPKKVLG